MSRQIEPGYLGQPSMVGYIRRHGGGERQRRTVLHYPESRPPVSEIIPWNERFEPTEESRRANKAAEIAARMRALLNTIPAEPPKFRKGRHFWDEHNAYAMALAHWRLNYICLPVPARRKKNAKQAAVGRAKALDSSVGGWDYPGAQSQEDGPPTLDGAHWQDAGGAGPGGGRVPGLGQVP